MFECEAYEAVRERYWKLFVDFGDLDGSGNAVSPGGRSMADFMQQRQSRVAAFIHHCFLVRDNLEMVALLPAESSASETEYSELVEVSDD